MSVRRMVLKQGRLHLSMTMSTQRPHLKPKEEGFDARRPGFRARPLSDARCWACGNEVEDTHARLGFEGIRHAVVRCLTCGKETHVRIA